MCNIYIVYIELRRKKREDKQKLLLVHAVLGPSMYTPYRADTDGFFCHTKLRHERERKWGEGERERAWAVGEKSGGNFRRKRKKNTPQNSSCSNNAPIQPCLRVVLQVQCLISIVCKPLLLARSPHIPSKLGDTIRPSFKWHHQQHRNGMEIDKKKKKENAISSGGKYRLIFS